MADHSSSRPIPLLNEYKYDLLRRRLLRTITGGAKVRKVPWYVHLIQLCLWVSPLVLYVPFVVVDALNVWNQYYIALVYAVTVGVYSLVLELLVVLLKHQKGGVFKNTQDDDEQDITLPSACDRTTIDFIFGRKRIHSLILHPLVAGLLSYAGGLLLLPSVLLENVHIAGLVFVFIIGWYTQCNAYYSLCVSAPNEAATFRPTDRLELRFVTRPFYVILLAVIFVAIRVLVVDPVIYLQVLYALLCLLVVGWAIGFLPPLDALVVWAMEQTLTRLLGGSAMATDIRLLLVFILSVCSVVIVSVLNDNTLVVLLSTTFGFILSQDLFSNTNLLLCGILSLCPSVPNRIKSLCNDLTDKIFVSFTGIDFSRVNTMKNYAAYWGVTILKGAILLGVSLAVVYFTFTAVDTTSTVIASKTTGGFVVGTFVLVQVSNALQNVYILGVFRNPLFPWTCNNFKRFKSRRKVLKYFSIPSFLATRYILPVLLCAYSGLGLNSEFVFSPSVWSRISMSRLLRLIWQDTSSAHRDLTVVALLDFIVPPTYTWSTIGLATQALVIGEIITILKEFLLKSFFAATVFFSFIAYKKHRTYLCLNVLIIVGTILLLPLVMIIILLSSVISAPLLPLFTLPIFTVSFPRPNRFWPGWFNFGERYSKCEDTVYYQQCQEEIVRAIHTSMTSGAVRSLPGTQILVRFDDRLIICSVLESGFGFRTLVLKGLELQETSCHTAEASRVDEIFESVYDCNSNGCSQFSLNTHFFNTLQPKDSAVVQTYSDAKNVLTGIIDQSSGLEKFSSNLLKSLVWVLFHHYRRSSIQSKHNCSSSPVNSSAIKSKMTITPNNEPNHNHIFTSNVPPPLNVDQINNNALEDDNQSWADSLSTLDGDSPAHPMKMLSLGSDTSLPSLIPEDRPGSIGGHTDRTDKYPGGKVENIFVSPSEIHLPSIPASGSTVHGLTGASARVHPQANNEIPCHIPESWSSVPISSLRINKLLSQFPTDWFTFIKELSSNSTNCELSSDQELQLTTLAVACFSIVDIPSVSTLDGVMRETTSFDVYQGFVGEFPYSVHRSWLTDDDLLRKLVQKAYRYAVKLLYDEGSLGDVEDYSELVDYLQEYDSDVFIGSDTEEGWDESILNKVPHLFSIARNQEENVYTAHVLTLQDQLIHIGELNSEAMRAVWSDLSFELFFLTNDDEERYSIQAHPTILRNLTIQSADPPLGYCVYSSGLIKLPGV